MIRPSIAATPGPNQPHALARNQYPQPYDVRFGANTSDDFVDGGKEKLTNTSIEQQLFANHGRLNYLMPGTEKPDMRASSIAHKLIARLVKAAMELQGASGNQQKLLTLSRAFVDTGLDIRLLSLLTLAAVNRKLDVNAMEEAFLQAFAQKHGIPAAKIDNNQLGKWNLDMIQYLDIELSNHKSPYRQGLAELCAVALEGRYKEYLHDEKTPLGRVNLETKKAFAETFKNRGIELDYRQWLNYGGKVNFRKPTREQALQTVHARLEEMLRNVPAKHWGTVDEMLRMEVGYSFKEGRLVALPDAKPIDAKLVGYFGKFTTSMDDNVVLDKLKATLLNLKDKNDEEIEIRLWKREPGDDLYQGNYTGACIALGYGRGEASVQVLQHTFVQLAEFYNKDQKQVTGKALMFWAKDLSNGDPVLIINTFEGREDGCEEEPIARDALLKFADQFGRKVAGREVRIYTADSIWNPLYTDDLPKRKLDLLPVGDSVTGEYYLDTFSGSWSKLREPKLTTSIYALKD